jgi:hypothetical protein
MSGVEWPHGAGGGGPLQEEEEEDGFIEDGSEQQGGPAGAPAPSAAAAAAATGAGSAAARAGAVLCCAVLCCAVLCCAGWGPWRLAEQACPRCLAAGTCSPTHYTMLCAPPTRTHTQCDSRRQARAAAARHRVRPLAGPHPGHARSSRGGGGSGSGHSWQEGAAPCHDVCRHGCCRRSRGRGQAGAGGGSSHGAQGRAGASEGRRGSSCCWHCTTRKRPSASGAQAPLQAAVRVPAAAAGHAARGVGAQPVCRRKAAAQGLRLRGVQGVCVCMCVCMCVCVFGCVCVCLVVCAHGCVRMAVCAVRRCSAEAIPCDTRAPIPACVHACCC